MINFLVGTLMTIKEIENDIFEAEPSRKPTGYLLCNKCHGFYKLKYGESLDDFECCECGGSLEYRKYLPKKSDIVDNSLEYTYNPDNFYEDYAELEELLNTLKRKSLNRKKVLLNLYKRINVQEELLNEIKEERWTLWDVLDQRDMQSDIDSQKSLIDDINRQEDRLQMIIKEQRNRAENNKIISRLERIDAVSLLIIAIVVVIVSIILIIV